MASPVANHLHKNLLNEAELDRKATRDGFGVGLLSLGKRNKRVMALAADLAESTRAHLFAAAFPERFVQVGVAEQNLVTVASGLAAEGFIPFACSFAAFSPGRNWEQIRTTICYNDQPVIIVGTHVGLSVGEDGATHQILEDIALMRALPNMRVIVPADALEAQRATIALGRNLHPSYLRLSRDKSPVFTTSKTPFTIGVANVLMRGSDVTVVACGLMVYEALQAAAQLAPTLSVEVINMHTIKPLDQETLLQSVEKTGAVVTAEEHQRVGGFGGAVAEVLGEHMPVPIERVGVADAFGESGGTRELWKKFGITREHIVEAIQRVHARKRQSYVS